MLSTSSAVGYEQNNKYIDYRAATAGTDYGLRIFLASLLLLGRGNLVQ